MKHLGNSRGYTLVELVVVMGIFVVIMLITTNSFQKVTAHVGQQSKSAETQIQGIVGLELLRSDLQQAGFGLPWSFQDPSFTYGEAEAASNNVPMAGIWPSSAPPSGTIWVKYLNDAPSNPPRAVVSVNTAFNKDSDGVGSKYLVIKSTVVAPVASNDPSVPAGATPAAKKWTTVSFSGGGHRRMPWSDASRELRGSDRVIVVKNSLNTTPPSQQLMVNGGTFYNTFDHYSTLTHPHQDGDTFELYAVHPFSNLRMPFNRADFYVARPATGMPQECAPNTGILYKSIVNHSDGTLAPGIPLLDCVADMQVVYGVDSTQQGFVNNHIPDPPSTALDVRTQVKEIRVYILAHEGKKDRGYSYPNDSITVGERFGSVVRGREFYLDAIGPDWRNYRWKVYTIVARPRNLTQ